MKIRILSLGLLGLVGLVLSATSASAFCLLPHCFHRNYSVIVCRPYNAFTPMCYGSVVCDGCCPSPCCGGGGGCQPPINQCMPSIYNGVCCDSTCMVSGPAYATTAPALSLPPAAAPLPNNPNFTPPPPTANPVSNQTSIPWNMQPNYGVQPAAYFPGYYPSYPAPYYPMSNYPATNYQAAPPMPAPYYWYNQ